MQLSWGGYLTTGGDFRIGNLRLDYLVWNLDYVVTQILNLNSDVNGANSRIVLIINLYPLKNGHKYERNG